MNAVEREPVETRVFNPTASEASYKPKQRSYRKTNLKKKVLALNSPGAQTSGAELSAAETAAPKRTRPALYSMKNAAICRCISLILCDYMRVINSGSAIHSAITP